MNTSLSTFSLPRPVHRSLGEGGSAFHAPRFINHLPLLALSLALTGCAGTGQRVAFDSLSTVGGGAAAYYAGDKDPALTTAGAVSGFVVSEALQSMAASGREKAYNSGIEEGKAIGQEEVLKGLWEESNGLPRRNGSRVYQNLNPALNVPARIQNGVRYDAHSAEPSSIQPEKILVPAMTSTNAISNPHYETFQSTE